MNANGTAGGAGAVAAVGSRKNLYQQGNDRTGLLTRVRSVMISNMAKPEEVLVVEDDDGTVIREIQKDTEVPNAQEPQPQQPLH